MHIVNDIEDELFKNKRYETQCASTTKGPKRGGGFTSATVYRKQETEINNIRKVAAKFPEVGDMSRLPSGLAQVRDMMKPYIIRLWKLKHPVRFCKNVYVSARQNHC